jgi:hypothetical protein
VAGGKKFQINPRQFKNSMIVLPLKYPIIMIPLVLALAFIICVYNICIVKTE